MPQTASPASEANSLPIPRQSRASRCRKLSLPGVVGAGVLVFIFSLGFFVTPAILGGGKTIMVAEYINVQIHESLRWGVGTMIATTLIGTIFLLVCLIRAIKGHFTPQQHFGFEAAAWYWHFVDVVWLLLFILVYWL